VWAITLAGLSAVLLVDLLIIGRRPHEPSMKEASGWVVFYVLLACAFGVWIFMDYGAQYGQEFFAGWITEYSLSIDNLFIFLVILTKLKVPRQLQQFALLVGIILALVFRGIFIALGAAAINRFSWIFFAFGAFLIWTAVKLYLDYRKQDEETDAPPDNAVLRFVRRRFNATTDYRGTKLTVVENGKRLITPMLIVIIALGSTDLLFALDSIPAIYGLTQEPYLVFTANVFALMGLRQLYFLLGGFLDRLVYLSVGLSIILGFIGIKLILHALHTYHLADWLPFDGEIPIWVSLTVIIVTLTITTVASLVKSRYDQDRLATGDAEGEESGSDPGVVRGRDRLDGESD